jgi:hypothetical protein
MWCVGELEKGSRTLSLLIWQHKRVFGKLKCEDIELNDKYWDLELTFEAINLDKCSSFTRII